MEYGSVSSPLHISKFGQIWWICNVFVMHGRAWKWSFILHGIKMMSRLASWRHQLFCMTSWWSVEQLRFHCWVWWVHGSAWLVRVGRGYYTRICHSYKNIHNCCSWLGVRICENNCNSHNCSRSLAEWEWNVLHYNIRDQEARLWLLSIQQYLMEMYF